MEVEYLAGLFHGLLLQIEKYDVSINKQAFKGGDVTAEISVEAWIVARMKASRCFRRLYSSICCKRCFR